MGTVLASSHVFVGVTIGAVLRRHPVAAFAAGVASHVAMDMTPHWGTGGGPGSHARFLHVARRDGAGVIGAITAAGALSGRARRGVLAGAAGGLLLDLNKPCYHFFGSSPFPSRVDAFHGAIQRGKESPERWEREIRVCAALGALAAVSVLAARRRARRARSRHPGLVDHT